MTKTSLFKDTRLKIFLIIAFLLPYLMGILMGYSYSRRLDVSFFPNAQMYYPAAGIMLATLLSRKEDPFIPRRFYICFIILTIVMLVLTVMSVLTPYPQMAGTLNLVITLGSCVSWIFLLTEAKEKRETYGLNLHHIKGSVVMVVLFLVLYFGRVFLSYLISSQLGEFVQLFEKPAFYISFLLLPVNFFLVFTAFFGEEYGWRYYFTPFLQNRFGKVKGVLLLGILWGLWHLPINVFYYSPQTWFQSILSQQIVCIAYGIFLTYAYIKTNNIWVPVILHYLNNTLIVVLNGGNISVISHQVIGWKDLLAELILSLILFVPFILTKEYRRSEKTEVTASE